MRDNVYRTLRIVLLLKSYQQSLLTHTGLFDEVSGIVQILAASQTLTTNS